MSGRCIIYAFSGTGNSLLIASFLAAALKEHSIETDIFRVRYPLGEVPDPNAYEHVGFVYPIHGFNTPKPFISFLKTLPASKTPRKPYFIAKNSGEPFAANSASSSTLVHVLKKKGYVPTLEHHYLMPYNIMFAYAENLRKQMYLYSKAYASLMAEDIALGKDEKIHYKPGWRFLSWLVRLEWIAGPVNAPLTRVNKKRCIHCDACIRNCPVHAIYRDKRGRIRVRSNCCICMACSFLCPKDAFRMGFLDPWRVNFGGYQYDRLLRDDAYDGKHVNRNTKGYFRHFRAYYKEQNRLLLERGHPLPVQYDEADSLENWDGKK